MNHEFMELQVILSVTAHKAHSMHCLQKLEGINSNNELISNIILQNDRMILGHSPAGLTDTYIRVPKNIALLKLCTFS